MLLYDPKNFVRAAYFPFAEFSPEWQALLYGKQHQIPCRAIDLPAGIFFKNKFDSRTWNHHPFRKISEQTHFSDTEQWWDHFMEQQPRSEEHTSELQSRGHLVCRLLLEQKTTTL